MSLLTDWGTREESEGIGVGGLDAGFDFVVGGGSDHGCVVARIAFVREEYFWGFFAQ